MIRLFIPMYCYYCLHLFLQFLVKAAYYQSLHHNHTLKQTLSLEQYRYRETWTQIFCRRTRWTGRPLVLPAEWWTGTRRSPHELDLLLLHWSKSVPWERTGAHKDHICIVFLASCFWFLLLHPLLWPNSPLTLWR